MSDSSTPLSSEDYPIIHETQDTVQKGELESLIEILQYKLNSRDEKLRSIKYPNMLIGSLTELNNLVGMARLKDSIALQVMRLIDGANNGEHSSRMLNTILYGPPGVGKTKVGIILAKIWYALGYLKKPKKIKHVKPANISTTTTTIGSDINNNFGPIITILLIALFYGFAYIVSGVSYVYNNWGFTYLGILFLIVVLVLLFLYWNKKTYNYITNIVSENIQKDIKIDDSKIHEINDRDLITVVSRADLVAQYLGQTAPKTKALLQANLGKVVFIDEAYSLFNGERDQFGMEALTTINLFMSENPDSIAVIFAGYKNLMKYGIFRVQPGLPRRCMWHFECKGYDGEELSDIFFRQAYADGWCIRDQDYNNIRKLISDHTDLFENYGGDTERLLFFSQIEASRTNVMGSSESNTTTEYSSRYSSSCVSGKGNFNGCRGKTLIYEHVKRGLKRLRENNIKDN